VKKLLVALDGSPLAEQSILGATELARVAKASVLLARVIPAKRGDAASQSSADSAAAAESYLASWATQLRERGLTTDTVVLAGDPADALVAEARRQHVDLLVLTTHGRSGIRRLIYGSIAEAVLAHSTVPVFLVRAGAPAADLFPAGKRREIVAPLDGSPLSEAALPVAVDLARSLSAELQLVRIVVLSALVIETESGPRIPAELVEAEEQTATAYLTALTERLQSEGLTVGKTVHIASSAEGILETAEATHATLIVMATHGRSGVARTLLGSVAMDVLRRGILPVVFVRSGS
jgi:nucleotide-binding universal stress UspA family protein